VAKVGGSDDRAPEDERSQKPPVRIDEAGTAAVGEDDFLGRYSLDPFSGDAGERLGQVDVGIEAIEMDGDLLCLLVDLKRFDELEIAEEDVLAEGVGLRVAEEVIVLGVDGAREGVFVLFE